MDLAVNIALDAVQTIRIEKGGVQDIDIKRLDFPSCKYFWIWNLDIAELKKYLEELLKIVELLKVLFSIRMLHILKWNEGLFCNFFTDITDQY